jgi:hypothetical protein
MRRRRKLVPATVTGDYAFRVVSLGLIQRTESFMKHVI